MARSELLAKISPADAQLLFSSLQCNNKWQSPSVKIQVTLSLPLFI